MPVSLRKQGSVAILELNGKLSLGNSLEEFRAKWSDAVATGARDLVINLTRVPMVDSSGIGSLIRCHSAVTFHSFSSSADFTAPGAIFEGTRLTKAGDAITYGSSVGSINYSDSYGSPARNYSYARWTSPWFNTGIDFSELVSSWNAATPPGTWIQMEMQASPDNVYTTKWFVMGRWAFSDADIHRTSVGGQGDADGYVAIDTFFAKDHPF